MATAGMADSRERLFKVLKKQQQQEREPVTPLAIIAGGLVGRIVSDACIYHWLRLIPNLEPRYWQQPTSEYRDEIYRISKEVKDDYVNDIFDLIRTQTMDYEGCKVESDFENNGIRDPVCNAYHESDVVHILLTEGRWDIALQVTFAKYS